MSDTTIEWTDKTWNPTRGCSRISPGCEHCYAERQATRMIHGPYQGLVRSTPNGPRWTGVVRLADHKTLQAPLHWRNPRRIFVNSMSDLFHERLDNSHVDQVFEVMHHASWHTYQILTKRADRMHDYVNGAKWPTVPWIWLGVSVENQEYADLRMPILLNTPAAVRFVSVEPLLGPVDLTPWLSKIDWVIVGAESGPGARPMNEKWVRALRDQCVQAGVKFFYKQRLDERGRKMSLPVLDGRQWSQWPSEPRGSSA